MLNSPAITQFTTESGVKNALMEWLALWFDGNSHTISGAPVAFPKVSPAWGTGAVKQPLDNTANDAAGVAEGAEIRVVLHGRAELIETDYGYNGAGGATFDGKRVTDFVLLNFWIACKKQGHGQSSVLATQVGELLKALLTNPDTRYDLNLVGIYDLRPLPGHDVPSRDYARRLVPCAARLQYGFSF